MRKTGGNDLIKVAGQIEVQGTIFTWYPAKPSESPECSSCSSDIEQFDGKKNKMSSSFFVFSPCVLLYVESVVFLLFWLKFKRPADFCILFSIFVLFGVDSELYYF